MRRWVPYPLLAISLIVMWLLMNQSFSAVQLLLGAIVALIATWAMTALRPAPARLGSIGAIFRLLGIIIVDVIRSNLAVARIVLSPRRQRVSGFVRIPLTLRDRHGLTVLALILTAIPGTVWVQFDRSKGTLLIHVLDLVSEEDWIRLIRERYESLLLEVFEPWPR